MRGTHQGQQSARTAPTGRTHDCKRPLHHHAQHDLLQSGGDPHMTRRRFLAVLGVAVVAAPIAALAQQSTGIPRIGVLMGSSRVSKRRDSLRFARRSKSSATSTAKPWLSSRAM